MAQNAASIDIKDILVDEGIGTFAATTGWGIYVGRMPDDGLDTTITIYDTGNPDPEIGVAIDKPTIQILVRGTEWDYPGTNTKCVNIKNVLHRRPTETVNTTIYDGIYLINGPKFLEYDTKNRPVFSLNFRMFAEPSDTGYRI